MEMRAEGEKCVLQGGEERSNLRVSAAWPISWIFWVRRVLISEGVRVDDGSFLRGLEGEEGGDEGGEGEKSSSSGDSVVFVAIAGRTGALAKRRHELDCCWDEAVRSDTSLVARKSKSCLAVPHGAALWDDDPHSLM